jgi:hypothetical protein
MPVPMAGAGTSHDSIGPIEAMNHYLRLVHAMYDKRKVCSIIFFQMSHSSSCERSSS